MQESFTMEDLIGLLIGLETKGGLHYKKMAELTMDRELRDLFRQLALQEEKHLKFYEGLRDNELPFADSDGDGEYQAYLFCLMKETFSFLNVEETEVEFEEGYEQAVRLEKETLFLLNEIERIVLPAFRPTLQSIVEEERKHLRFLQTYRAQQG